MWIMRRLLQFAEYCNERMNKEKREWFTLFFPYHRKILCAGKHMACDDEQFTKKSICVKKISNKEERLMNYQKIHKIEVR